MGTPANGPSLCTTSCRAMASVLCIQSQSVRLPHVYEHMVIVMHKMRVAKVCMHCIRTAMMDAVRTQLPAGRSVYPLSRLCDLMKLSVAASCTQNV